MVEDYMIKWFGEIFNIIYNQKLNLINFLEVQGVYKYPPPSLYVFLTCLQRVAIFFWSPSRDILMMDIWQMTG